MKNRFSIVASIWALVLSNTINAQNSPNSDVNLALLGDATVSSNYPPGTGRGAPGDVLYDPATGNYAVTTGYAENGVTYNQNLGTVSQGNGYNWQVQWTSLKNINYITFGGTYPNQPQPNTRWIISYFDGPNKIILDQGTGGWIDSGTYEWGGTEQTPISTNKILLEIFSDGINDLVSIHIRGRGGSSIHRDTSNESVKACLIQYLPSNNTDSETPSAPTLTSTAQTDTTVDLSWSGATDNVGVTSYSVFQDNVVIQSTINGTTYQVTGLTASTAYDFTVRAYDAAGNESPNSNILSLSTNSGNTGGGGSSIWTENNTTASYSGEVAIGRSTVPSGYQLAVDGNIRTREVRVDQDNWPDYVFTEGYDLPSLSEIKKHIQEKGHLSKIPTAKEVNVNGIELGEMNKLLLEKIEELTLLLIQQEEKLKHQQHQIDNIKKTLKP